MSTASVCSFTRRPSFTSINLGTAGVGRKSSRNQSQPNGIVFSVGSSSGSPTLVWSKYWNGFCFQALAGAGRDWADEREWGRNATLQDEEIVP
jgi:hypothetical protein